MVRIPNDAEMDDLIEKLPERMEEDGVDEQTLAYHMGVATQTVKRWVDLKRVPSMVFERLMIKRFVQAPAGEGLNRMGFMRNQTKEE